MKELLNNFRKDFAEAVKEIEKKYGFELQLERISYNPDGSSFEGKISAIRVKDGKSGEQVKFEEDAPRYGFKPEDYKKEYIVDGKKYLLVGFNPKARRNKYIIEDASTGTKYNCDKDYLGMGRLTLNASDDEIEEQRKKDFEFNAFMFGFKPSDYRKEFSKNGKTYQLIGFKPRARKNSYVIVDVETNKEYICTREFIL